MFVSMSVSMFIYSTWQHTCLCLSISVNMHMKIDMIMDMDMDMNLDMYGQCHGYRHGHRNGHARDMDTEFRNVLAQPLTENFWIVVVWYQISEKSLCRYPTWMSDSDIGGSDTRLRLVSFITDIGLSSHLGRVLTHSNHPGRECLVPHSSQLGIASSLE